MTQPDEPAVTSPPVPPQAIAKPECEHYWAFHCHDGLSVRLCQLCHEPDWEDVRRELAEAVAAERERCAQLAGRVGAIYPLPLPVPEVTVDGEPVPVTAGNAVIWPDGMPAVGLVANLLRQDGGGT